MTDSSPGIEINAINHIIAVSREFACKIALRQYVFHVKRRIAEASIQGQPFVVIDRSNMNEALANIVSGISADEALEKLLSNRADWFR